MDVDVAEFYCIVLFQAKHAQAKSTTWGVDGETGNLVDMQEFGIWDPLSVKAQTYKTAIEVCYVIRLGLPAVRFVSSLGLGCQVTCTLPLDKF